jgi:hypothetical protein
MLLPMLALAGCQIKTEYVEDPNGVYYAAEDIHNARLAYYDGKTKTRIVLPDRKTIREGTCIYRSDYIPPVANPDALKEPTFWEALADLFKPKGE